jgi:hypothetical protein
MGRALKSRAFRVALAILMAKMFLSGMPRADSQVINQTIPDPSRASVVTTQQTVKAGEPLTFTLIFDNAPSTDIDLIATFRSGTDGFQANFTLKAGETTAKPTAQIPGNIDGGDYVLSEVQHFNGKRYDSIPVDRTTIHVTPQPPQVRVMPSKASVIINQNQRQYIRDQATPIKKIRSDLLAGLEKNPIYSEELRQNLINALTEADLLLPAVQAGYVSRYEHTPTLQPALFEDFHRNYQAAIIELKNNTSGAHAGTPAREPRFALAQMQQRKKPEGDAASDWLNHTLVGTYPLAARAGLIILNENIRAYLLIGDTGLDTFSIKLESLPTGAVVSYMRVGEEYKPLGKSTNIPSVIFPFALWTFKFEKTNCATITQPVDPYVDAKPEIYVELVCKQ